MINKTLRAAIIVTARTILLTLALLALAPWFINKELIQHWQQALAYFKPWFITLHGLFYLALLVLWPQLIRRIKAQNQLSKAQIKTALTSRWYLLTIFLFIDALIGLRG